jgi:hypothetical protein
MLAMTRAHKVDRLLLDAYGETDWPSGAAFFMISTNLTSSKSGAPARPDAPGHAGVHRHSGLLPPIVIDGRYWSTGRSEELPTEVCARCTAARHRHRHVRPAALIG